MPDRSNARMARQLGGALTVAGVISCLAACGSSGSPASSPGTTETSAPAVAAHGTASPQAPVPAESNPPGDIPDTTVYVIYQSPAAHMALKVPEGWSRKSTPTSSTYTSNLNSITVAWMPMSGAPTVSSARATTVRALQSSAL